MLKIWVQLARGKSTKCKTKQIFRILTLALSVVMIGGVLGVGIAHAAYTHTLLKPWGSSYQTCTYRVQSTFAPLTKTQFEDAMQTWNRQLTKQFLFKSSAETQDEKKSKNGINTLTKYNYGDTWTGLNTPWFNFWKTYYVESDIEFNTFHKWANSGDYPDRYDVQSTSTHESGHTLRLDRSKGETDVMWPYAKKGDISRRFLTNADIEAARDFTKRWFK
ncbi:MAG: matrixin family metalloprotease [Actinobacteria bacterium]|nr:matrixin family metalloprotease [Actinomycetota bacterium]